MERGMFVGKYGANHTVIERAYLGNMIFFKSRYLFNSCKKYWAGSKGRLKAVVQKYSQEMAVRRCLEKSCKNIHAPPPIGTGFPKKYLTLGGAEVFI